jgi:hypothetical protein
MACAFPCVVKAMLGKFHGKTMIRGLMQTCNETLYHLLGEHFYIAVFFYFAEVNGHWAKSNDVRSKFIGIFGQKVFL